MWTESSILSNRILTNMQTHCKAMANTVQASIRNMPSTTDSCNTQVPVSTWLATSFSLCISYSANTSPKTKHHSNKNHLNSLKHTMNTDKQTPTCNDSSTNASKPRRKQATTTATPGTSTPTESKARSTGGSLVKVKLLGARNNLFQVLKGKERCYIKGPMALVHKGIITLGEVAEADSRMVICPGHHLYTTLHHQFHA